MTATAFNTGAMHPGKSYDFDEERKVITILDGSIQLGELIDIIENEIPEWRECTLNPGYTYQPNTITWTDANTGNNVLRNSTTTTDTDIYYGS